MLSVYTVDAAAGSRLSVMKALFGSGLYSAKGGHVVKPKLSYSLRAGENAFIEPVSKLSRV